MRHLRQRLMSFSAFARARVVAIVRYAITMLDFMFEAPQYAMPIRYSTSC